MSHFGSDNTWVTSRFSETSFNRNYKLHTFPLRAGKIWEIPRWQLMTSACIENSLHESVRDSKLCFKCALFCLLWSLFFFFLTTLLALGADKGSCWKQNWKGCSPPTFWHICMPTFILHSCLHSSYILDFKTITSTVIAIYWVCLG